MSEIYEKHGIIAKKFDDETINAGRYSFQKKEEKKIPSDVIKKLLIKKEDICLDIGCNLGLNLLPIAKLAKHITGIDQPNCIKKLKEKIKDNKNVKLIGDDFLSHQFQNKKYKKIIIYSVIHTLKNKKEAYKFIMKAINLLEPQGKILIGDIPNVSLKKRFINSQNGKKFLKKWNKINKMSEIDITAQRILEKDKSSKLLINDEFILNLLRYLRKKHYNVFLIKQNSELPFGNTREDIIIEKL